MPWLKIALYPAAFLMMPAILCLGLSVAAGREDPMGFTYFTYAIWWASGALTWLIVAGIGFLVAWAINRIP